MPEHIAHCHSFSVTLSLAPAFPIILSQCVLRSTIFTGFVMILAGLLALRICCTFSFLFITASRSNDVVHQCVWFCRV
jgi:hypothetical protein